MVTSIRAAELALPSTTFNTPIDLRLIINWVSRLLKQIFHANDNLNCCTPPCQSGTVKVAAV